MRAMLLYFSHTVCNKPLAGFYSLRFAISFLAGTLGFVFNVVMVEVSHFSPADLSWVRAIGSTITIVFPILAGNFVDNRISINRLAFLIFLGVLFWFPALMQLSPIGWAFTIGFLGAYASIGDMLIARSIPALFEKSDYQRVTALLFLVGALTVSIAAIIAGQVIEYLNVATLVFFGVTITLTMALVTFVSFDEDKELNSVSSEKTNLFAGFKIILGDQQMRVMLTYGCVSIITFTAVDTLLYIFLSEIARLSTSSIAFVISIRAFAGALAPSLAMSRTTERFREVFFGLAIFGGISWLLIGLLGQHLNLLLVVIIVTVPAITSSLFNVFAATFRQIVIPIEMQARSMAATRAIMWSSMPLSGLLIHFLAEVVTLEQIFIGAGALQILGSTILLAIRKG